MLIDYRGYGKSEGAATLDGAIEDIQLSISYALKHYSDSQPFIVMGQSVGASMAVYAVATSSEKQHIDGLVLVSPFSDYHKVVRQALAKSWLTWLFQYPLSWTVSNDYRPASYIQAVNPMPVYLIHGTADKIISSEHSVELYELALEPKQLYLIEGGHNEVAATDKYREVLLQILQDITTISAH